MSDFSIPGAGLSDSVQRVIDDLMAVESRRLERLQDSSNEYQVRYDGILDLSRLLRDFADSARSLYGFQNPFDSSLVSSSNPAIISGIAESRVEAGDYTFRVIQAAAADKLLSSPLATEYTVPEGNYGFSVGNEDFTFRFRGGTLQSFAETINRRSTGLVSASVISNTRDTEVLTIQSTRTGISNALTFLDDSQSLAKEIGLFRQQQPEPENIDLTGEALSPWSNPLNMQLIRLSPDRMNLLPQAEGAFPLPQRDDVIGEIILEYQVQLVPAPVTATEPAQQADPEPLPGPLIPQTGGINFEGIQIKSEPSIAALPESQPWTGGSGNPQVEDAPVPIPRQDTQNPDQVLFIQSAGGSVPLPEVINDGEAHSFQVALSGEYDGALSLNFLNSNPNSEVVVSNIAIWDSGEQTEWVPANYISQASDSIVVYQGVEVSREGNRIDDLVPGLSLNVIRPGDEEVSLTINPDRETVKDSIITFVGNYNRLMAEINILSSRDSDIMSEISYFTEEERETYTERLGLFSGDSTLNRLKGTLQTAMMNAYNLQADSSLTLLSQIGISSNASSGGFAGRNSSQLRGYLDIDENALDTALEGNFSSVRELFGKDTDNDFIVDTGVAFALNSVLDQYVRSGNILTTRMNTLTSQISRINSDIGTEEERLEDRQAELEYQMAQMENARHTLEQSSQSMQNMFPSGN